MVKLADRITNLGIPPKHWDIEKIKKYQKEASFILSCLGNSNIYLAKRLAEKIEDYNKYISK
jgi:(p)ppGpp synthase/HD superfamily hydrolase